MAVPSVSANFADLLDPRFLRIFNDEYKQLPDRIAEFYTVLTGGSAPTRDTLRMSEVGAFGDIPEFTGTVTYDDVFQGYDTTATHKEYASGFQVERKLFDDGQYGIMDAKPSGMATAYSRTRQKHAAQTFNNAFSSDSTWQSGGDGVALCSNSHTTNSSASTANGFDNLVTTSFSAVALASARVQMRGFRGDRAERISVVPSSIIHPPDIYDLVFEVTQSAGKPATADNDANVHRGVYATHDWEYLTDANNWFLADPALMRQMLYWIERIGSEFAMVEDMDTIIGKWRLYARYSLMFRNWRFILGAQVS